jgi:hypothetical protein
VGGFFTPVPIGVGCTSSMLKNLLCLAEIGLDIELELILVLVYPLECLLSLLTKIELKKNTFFNGNFSTYELAESP